MDRNYIVARSTLFELLKKAFESGCHGYLDLRDSNCERLLDEFQEEQETNKSQKTFSIEDNVRQQALWPQTTVGVTASEGSWTVGYATLNVDVGNQEAVSDGVMGESGGPVGPVGEVGETGLPGDPGVPGVMPDQNPMSSQGNGSEAI